MTAYDAINIVMDLEGGHVNDPDDPGGETRYGISQRAFPDMDMALLTKDRARTIYHQKYWIPAKVEMMPNELQLIYFDMCVNMGQRAAVRVLQRAVNHKSPDGLKEDGIFGIDTLTAVNTAKLERDRVRSFRVLRYARIVARKPRLMKYWYGWYNRAMKV